MIATLTRLIKNSLTKKRRWTPEEVRKLIASRDLAAASSAVDHLIEGLPEADAVKQVLLGEIAFQARNDTMAQESFDKALRIAPGMAAAHHGLSLLLAERQDFDAAVRHAQFSVTATANEARFLAQLGYCHIQLGNAQIAEGPLRAATKLDPGHIYAWNNLGIVLLLKGQIYEAKDCFRRAATLDPSFELATAHLQQIEEDLERLREAGIEQEILRELPAQQPPTHLAVNVFEIRELEAQGDLATAIDTCEACALNQADEEFFALELARLHERAGDVQSAVDVLVAYLARHADNLNVEGALGLAYVRLNDFKKAHIHLSRALETESDQRELLQGQARALSGMEKFTAALPLLERALQLAPDDIQTKVHYGACLANCCRYEEALTVCDELAKYGKRASFQGSTLAFLGRFDEALAVIEESIAVQPNEPNLRFQRAHIRLLRHDYAGGWEDYAFRGLSNSKHFRVLPLPQWRDEFLEGKRIIVLAEQGLGDQIMFASCLPDLLALRPSKVIVEVISRVAKTVERSFPDCQVVSTKQDSSLDWLKEHPADYFVPLGDLPARFRRSLEDFPIHQGYLHAAPQRVAYWKAKLDSLAEGKLRIGLSWRGGTESTRTSLRTLDSRSLAELVPAIDAQWVCLQYGEVGADLTAADEAGLKMAYWPEAISDLDEFSALISTLDLVITVCNTTVHYAGALNKPVWVMSPRVPEWRYGLTNSALPWYPSSRMFRQPNDGDWQSVLAAIHQALKQWAASFS